MHKVKNIIPIGLLIIWYIFDIIYLPAEMKNFGIPITN